MVTVADMREIAQSILDQLDGMDENRKIHARCNTYGMESTIIEVKSWCADGGFVDYDNIVFEDEDDEEED